MGLKLLNEYGDGTFDELRDYAIGLGMGKTFEELEPLRFAMHGLARRGKATFENGVFKRLQPQQQAKVQLT